MNQAAPGIPGSEPVPASPAHAADLLATAQRLQRAVHYGGSWVYVSWLVGMAVANFMFLAGLGVMVEATAIGLLAIAFGACVAALSIGLLPRARVSRVGFPRRFAAAMLVWAGLFSAALTVGLLFFRGVPAFWLPAAVVVALPLVLGARAEAAA